MLHLGNTKSFCPITYHEKRGTYQFTNFVVFFKTYLSNEPVKFKVLHHGYHALLTKKGVV